MRVVLQMRQEGIVLLKRQLMIAALESKEIVKKAEVARGLTRYEKASTARTRGDLSLSHDLLRHPGKHDRFFILADCLANSYPLARCQARLVTV